MTKLPPGFMHEMRHHLTHKAELDPETGVPILPLEDFCCGSHDQRPIPNRWLPILIQPLMAFPL